VGVEADVIVDTGVVFDGVVDVSTTFIVHVDDSMATVVVRHATTATSAVFGSA
jgi:hypothetical protein